MPISLTWTQLLILIFSILGLLSVCHELFPRFKKYKVFFIALGMFSTITLMCIGFYTDHINKIDKYSEYALLDAFGRHKNLHTWSDITSTFGKGGLLADTGSGSIAFDCDDGKIDEFINGFPYFPFIYFFKAGCLQLNNNDSWKIWAKKAISSLEITTTFGHHPDHDGVLSLLRDSMANSKISLRTEKWLFDNFDFED